MAWWQGGFETLIAFGMGITSIIGGACVGWLVGKRTHPAIGVAVGFVAFCLLAGLMHYLPRPWYR